MKALSTKALKTVRALRYPTYQRLVLQRALAPAFGSIMMGVGNLSSLGLGTLHGSGSVSMMTAHIVTYVVIVVPSSRQKGAA
jgi:hypothetical protein